jgi:hypothetical protein
MIRRLTSLFSFVQIEEGFSSAVELVKNLKMVLRSFN